MTGANVNQAIRNIAKTRELEPPAEGEFERAVNALRDDGTDTLRPTNPTPTGTTETDLVLIARRQDLASITTTMAELDASIQIGRAKIAGEQSQIDEHLKNRLEMIKLRQALEGLIHALTAGG